MDPVPDDGSVVLLRWRTGPRLLVTVLGAVILLGIAIAVVDAVRSGDPARPWRSSGLGPTGRAVGWFVTGAVTLALVFGITAAWRQAFRLSADDVGGRPLWRWLRLPVDAVERVEFRRARGTHTAMPRPAGVRVVLRDARGRRRSFVLAGWFTDVDAALDVVVGWVRRRPDLAPDDETARLLGVPRGAP